MGFFLIKKRDNKLIKIDQNLQHSFGTVKKDVFKIFQWLNYLYHQNLHQDQIIKHLQKQINDLPKTKQEIRDLVDLHYSLEPLQNQVEKMNRKLNHFEDSHSQIMALKYKLEEVSSKVSSIESSEHLQPRIEEIKSKINQLETNHEPLQKHLEEHHTRLENLENSKISLPQQKTTTVRENLIRKIAKSSKDHIRTIIKSLIVKYGQISALQLREIIVEEQGLCSKSSFYRILEELEQDEDISVMHEKKEKKFTFNTIKTSYSKI